MGKLTPVQARELAQKASGEVAGKGDPAQEKAEDRRSMTVAELVDLYLAEHVKAKRKPKTYEDYRHALGAKLVPAIGKTRLTKVTRTDLARLHISWRDTPYQANAVLRVVRAMYGFAARRGLVPEGFNPAKGVEPFPTQPRERFLSVDELKRLGAALREGEGEGIPWPDEPDGQRSKHTPKREENRRTVIDTHAVAAIRLLLFTGCRLREILHLEWPHVDMERGLLLLPDSKAGRKTVILNAPALKVLAELARAGRHVIVSDRPDRPRHDLKRPWAAVTRMAGLEGLRIHDLRHNFASFGAGGGLGLPIGQPPIGGPVGMLVHDWLGRYGRGGWRSGSGWRASPT